jgi:hypothetical protein
MNRSADRNAMDLGQSSQAPAADGDSAHPNYPDRRFRHARNANGGVDSVCGRCQAVIASSADEWSLLAHEARHVCGSPGNPMAGASEIHKQRGK